MPSATGPPFQSTLPYGSDLARSIKARGRAPISIHAPLRERLARGYPLAKWQRFQSTLPYGSDHQEPPPMAQVSQISIHAPLRERLDVACLQSRCRPISIHAPLRERLWLYKIGITPSSFQSTLPYGSDSVLCSGSSFGANFNPRSLTGATLAYGKCIGWDELISIHAPLRERRALMLTRSATAKISIHAPLRERLFACLRR